MKTLSTDAADNGGGGASATGNDYGISLTFGGNDGSGTQSGTQDIAGDVAVTNTGSITTGYIGSDGTRFGRNAHGILAQSIGGGGLAGDTAWTEQLFAVQEGSNHDGNGGDVSVTVGSASDSSALVQTSGANAPAVLLQSLGGGGRFTNKEGALIGAAGGTDNSGVITADVYSTVSATGVASKGIYAEGADASGSLITINVQVAAPCPGARR